MQDPVLTKNPDGSVTKSVTVQETVTRDSFLIPLKMAQQRKQVAQESLDRVIAEVTDAQAQLDKYDALVKAQATKQ